MDEGMRGRLVSPSGASQTLFSAEMLGWQCSESAGFRHFLRRDFKSGDRLLLAIGFNPSTATQLKHDRTTQTLERIADRHGYSSWSIVNIFDRRATNPVDLAMHDSWRSEKWREALEDQSRYPSDFLVMWGGLPRRFHALASAAETLATALMSASSYGLKPRVLTIGLTKGGDPRHVLYTRNDAILLPWDASACHGFETNQGD